MPEILLYSLVFCLALYGLAHIISRVIHSCLPDSSKVIKTPYTVLCVKNQADSIEATVRSLTWHILSQNKSREVSDIIIVDLGSSDETFDILIHLSREYEFLHPMSKERYIELVDSL